MEVGEDYLFTKHRSDQYPLSWITALKLFNDKLTPFGNTWTIPRKGSDAYYFVTNLLRTKLNTGRLTAENRRLKSDAELKNNNYINPLKFHRRDVSASPSSAESPASFDRDMMENYYISPVRTPVSYASTESRRSRDLTPIPMRPLTPEGPSDVESISSSVNYKPVDIIPSDEEMKMADQHQINIEEQTQEKAYQNLLQKSPYSQSINQMMNPELLPPIDVDLGVQIEAEKYMDQGMNYADAISRVMQDRESIPKVPEKPSLRAARGRESPGSRALRLLGLTKENLQGKQKRLVRTMQEDMGIQMAPRAQRPVRPITQSSPQSFASRGSPGASTQASIGQVNKKGEKKNISFLNKKKGEPTISTTRQINF